MTRTELLSASVQMFPETFIVRAFFPKVSQFCHTEFWSMRAVKKILGARASEHSSNFCHRFEQGQILHMGALLN